MAHFPVNHHLLPLYRTLAGLAGAYVLAFGIVAYIRAGNVGFFAQENLPTSLGLHANRAFGLLSIIVGAVLLVGAILGGNLDYYINVAAGTVFLLAGMVMLVFLRTDLNFLGFTVTTCVVSFVIGLILALAGLYGRVGTPEDVAYEEQFRHGRQNFPQDRPLPGPVR